VIFNGLKVSKSLALCKHLILLFCLVFITQNIAEAHHGAEGIFTQGGGLAGPIITIPAYTLPKGIKYFGLGTDYINFDTFSSSQLVGFNNHGKDVHTTNNLFIPTAYGGLGITDKLTLTTSIPYVCMFGVNTAEGGKAINLGNSIGIGDITFLGKYRFLKIDKFNLQSSLVAGIKIPSGVHRDRNNQGGLFEADDQPATGSWDPLVGLAISKKIKSIFFSTNFLYKFSTKGTQSTVVGDVASYNVAATYRINDKICILNKIFPQHISKKDLIWDLVLEGNGQWAESPQMGNEIDINHGGTLIYLTPGIRITYDKKWISNIAVGFPVIHALNGIQKPPDVRLIFGIVRAF